jgi:hypothetical protein
MARLPRRLRLIEKIRAIHVRECLQGDSDMTRHWLAGAAAFAMMTGVAFAQDTSSESSTTTRSTTSTVPGVGSYSSSETRQGTDRDGNAVDTKTIFHGDAGGSTATTQTRTASPDGSALTTSQEKQTDTPNSGSTTEKTTTTTIDR